MGDGWDNYDDYRDWDDKDEWVDWDSGDLID